MHCLLFCFRVSRIIKTPKKYKILQKPKHALSFLACAFYFLHLGKRPKTTKKSRYAKHQKHVCPFYWFSLFMFSQAKNHKKYKTHAKSKNMFVPSLKMQKTHKNLHNPKKTGFGLQAAPRGCQASTNSARTHLSSAISLHVATAWDLEQDREPRWARISKSETYSIKRVL